MKWEKPIGGVREQLRQARRKASKTLVDLEGNPLDLDALFAELRNMKPLRADNEFVELLMEEKQWIRLKASDAHIKAGTWNELCDLKRLELKLRRQGKRRDAALLRKMHTKLFYNRPIVTVDQHTRKP